MSFTTSHCQRVALCPRAAGVLQACPAPRCHLPAGPGHHLAGGARALGAPRQVVQFLCRVQLHFGVLLCCVLGPCTSAYGWGQQLVLGTLVPHQLMGLGLGAVVQWESLCLTGSGLLHVPAHPGPLPPRHPTAQRWVQGPPVLHTLPGSAWNPAEASNKNSH